MIVGAQKLFNSLLWIVVAIGVDKVIELVATIAIELLFEHVDVAEYAREVKVKHLVMIAQWSGVAAYPQGAKKLVEAIGLRLVVVSPHHTDEKALAESSGTDEDQCTRLVFQFSQIHSLIDIVHILIDHRLKICHSVWYLLYSFHLSSSLFAIHVQKYDNYHNLPNSLLQILVHLKEGGVYDLDYGHQFQ